MKRYNGPKQDGVNAASGTGGPTPPRAAMSRPVLLVGVVALCVAGLMGWLALTQPSATGGNGSTTAGTDAIGGPFHLVDQNGHRVDQSILRGHWSAVFFGYVSCPDVCPATLQTLAVAQARLGADAGKVQDVFITVDPTRDTPAQLKAWIDQPGFPKTVVALTGTPAEIAQAAKAYRIYYRKEDRPADYQVEHTAAIFLMNPQGRFVAPLSYEQGPDKLAKALADAIHGG